MSSLCEHLRVVTRPEHRALDRSLLAGRPFVDVDSYVDFLDRMRGFHTEVERRLHHHPLVLRSGHAPRSPAAAHDLERLVGPGATSRQSGPASLAVTDHERPIVDDPDDATIVGMLYVVEGSSLGGRHLAALVRRRLPEAASSLSFLDAYGDDTDRRWSQTCEVIDQSGVDREGAASAARITFRLAAAHLAIGLDTTPRPAGVAS